VDKPKPSPGLLSWVEDYKKMRSAGNVKGAKQIKKNIDAAIKKEGLDSKSVYFHNGDPDSKSK
jgi:hypothetical protein